MSQPTVPFLDLTAVNARFKNEYVAALDSLLSDGWLILGRNVKEFEEQFAQYVGARHCIGVANGLEALTLMLRAQDFPPGSEIIVPSNTYIATALAVSHAGLTPVLVEPDPDTMNLSAANIKAAISKQTVGILAVHLYGLACDMTSLKRVANEFGLKLFEDCAQSHGAWHAGIMTGAWGDAAGFSFYPGKNLGALGDGGAIVTNDDLMANQLRCLRNYGSARKYENDVKGYNSRLDEVQAAWLKIRLNSLEADNRRRREIAERYLAEIRCPFLKLPARPNDQLSHVWHLFVVRCTDRMALQGHLLDCGIQTMIHYPIAIHRQPAYSEMAPLHLPLAEQLAETVLSLPISPVMPDDHVDQVISAVKSFKSLKATQLCQVSVL